MNPATREQKNSIVKILNEADVDPATGDRTVLPPFLCGSDTAFQRSSSRPQRCISFPLPKFCAKISRSPRKTLTSRHRVHSPAR